MGVNIVAQQRDIAGVIKNAVLFQPAILGDDLAVLFVVAVLRGNELWPQGDGIGFFLAEIEDLRLASYGTVGLVFILSFVVLQAVAAGLVRPIDRLAGAMAAVKAGEISTTLPLIGRDEFSEIARGFNGMMDGLRERIRLEGSFKRYVPAAVVREAAEKGEVARLGGELVSSSIFFADVRGFTSASEKLSPSAVVDLLNLYFVPFVVEISAAGGTIDKFIGDAVLAVWGAPEPCTDHAERAVSAAVKIQ